MRLTITAALILYISMANGATIFITSQTTHIDGHDKHYENIKPGDTLLLQNGNREPLQLMNLRGAPGKYITIINDTGQCNISTSVLPYGISVRNCQYICLNGSGANKYSYGIRVIAVNHEGAGIGVSERSDNIEICHIEIAHTQGPGILCKTNADCITDQSNYVQYNTAIHHNYIHHTGTEGMYIGSTAFEGTHLHCDSSNQTILPPLLKNVQVYDNLVEHTGWDGIQISLATQVTCHNNHIAYDSEKKQEWQNCGLIIGGGASGKFYSNRIEHGNGYGINCFGKGKVEIAGNVILMDSTRDKVAIYTNDKLADKKTAYRISDNDITTSYLPAIKTVNNKSRRPDKVLHNTIHTTGSGQYVQYEGKQPVYK